MVDKILGWRMLREGIIGVLSKVVGVFDSTIEGNEEEISSIWFGLEISVELC